MDNRGADGPVQTLAPSERGTSTKTTNNPNRPKVEKGYGMQPPTKPGFKINNRKTMEKSRKTAHREGGGTCV